MSYLYTGTPALKTDFTRTGKRTHQGAFNDGVNAVTRYFINNFTDGYYHDCLDIATLRLVPEKSKLRKRSFIQPVIISLGMTILMTCVAHYLFMQHAMPKVLIDQVLEPISYASYDMKQKALHAIICIGTLISGISYIITNGRNYTDDSSRFV